MANITNITGSYLSTDVKIEEKPLGQIVSLCYPLSSGQESVASNSTPMLLFTIFRKSGTATHYNELMDKGLVSANTMAETTLAVIGLPMPSNGLNDAVTNQIDAGNSSFINQLISEGLLTLEQAGGAAAVNGAVGSIKQEIVSNIKKISGAYNTNLGGSKTISGTRGIHAYQGTEPRSFIFNYRFYPKTIAELKEIASIIHTFTKASVPTFSGSTNGMITHESPPFVSVREIIKNKTNQNVRYTPKFGTGIAQIAGVRITKGADGVYGTLAGTAGDANIIEFEVSVKEILPPTTQLFDEIESNNYQNELNRISSKSNNNSAIDDWKKLYNTMN